MEEKSIDHSIESLQRSLNTVQEEEILASGTFSRTGSLRRKKKEHTPRPMWRY